MRTATVFAGLFIFAFPHSLAVWTDAESLQTHLASPLDNPFVKCLKDAGLDPVVNSSSSYPQSAAPFNLRLPWKPAAIVYPNDTNDVSEAVKCGAKHNVKVNARCGGHSYAAFGLGGEDGHLTVSLDKLRNLSLAANGSVTIGGGNRLGDVALYLWNHGQRALAHGTCPFVGIGGHAGQGGFGLASRHWGLLSDQISAIEIVIANGTKVTASADQNPDLFWAAMGAGSSFGIITSFTAGTHPAMDSVAFSYRFAHFSAEDASRGLQAWQSFVNTSSLNSRLGLQLRISPLGTNDTRPAGVVFSVTGQYYGGDYATVISTMAPLIQHLGNPTSTFTEQQTWIESVLYLSESGSTDPNSLNTTGRTEVQDRFFATSTFVSQNEVLNTSSTEALMKYLYGEGAIQKVQWFVLFDLYGGQNSAISRLPPDHNSFNARDALYSIQYYGSIPLNSTASDDAKTIQFIKGMKAAVEDNQPGTIFKEYVNYIDSTYTPDEAHKKYYPTHTERLTAIKQQYDPDRVIHHPHDFSATSHIWSWFVQDFF